MPSIAGALHSGVRQRRCVSIDVRSHRIADITINGEPVTDVKASHLSIMHGLLGLKLPDGDPYAVAGVPRDVVKDWIVAALGKGRCLTFWPRKLLDAKKPSDQARLQSFNARAVGEAICSRYSFMAAPARAVADSAGLKRLAHLGRPEDLLALRLQAIEARALTSAMILLWNWPEAPGPALALPVHDSLIVAQPAVTEAKRLIEGAFEYHAKVKVRTTIDQKPTQP